ncbi:DUF554 domain-containing protein [Thermocrinis minervae]|uniref:DUF554 domain-containing protein n=1 Tax=Thermocrinis minervae TaxID=381751 RepID=A0A1M6T9A9_9AQUI|nr:DUF554 domain-containing protein [Thermocrinis minervae]SHK53553.1 hypothetical protein SAMN05444391_1356 [Thermocrinis minervae]
MFPTFGTWVNASLILLGSWIGLHLGKRLPHSVRSGFLTAVATFTLILGVKLIYENTGDTIKVFLSLLVGSVLGHLLGLEERLQRFTESDLYKGFLSASLLFTVGPMTFLGCLLEATKGDSSLLLSKGLMDGLSSVMLASTFGRSVIFSAFFVLVYQGLLTLIFYTFANSIPQENIKASLFIGGGMLLILSLKLFGLLDQIKLLNLLPAMIFSLLV